MVSRRNRRNLQRKRRSTRRSYRKQRGGIIREGRALCISEKTKEGINLTTAMAKCEEEREKYEERWNNS